MWKNWPSCSILHFEKYRFEILNQLRFSFSPLPPRKICCIIMTGFAKRVWYAHNFKSHVLPPFDIYNNRLTVHACTIAKGSTVYFYWGLIHGPVWHPSVLRSSVNGSNLPWQADSWQGITTRLAGENGCWCSYTLWHVQLKTAWIEAICP